VALEQLGFLTPSPAHEGRSTSTTLPYSIPANQAYSAGSAGLVSHSGDVSLTAGAKLQPAGAAFPGSFSYALYRVDDLAQQVTTLRLNLGSSSPGAQLGVVVYNWDYGSLGRWEPVYYGDAGQSSLTLDVSDGSFISAGSDMAFAVFCLAPDNVHVNSFVLSTALPNPDYDEIEVNDTIESANPLPSFPFTGLRGNIGVGGPYDGSADDYFSFTGNVGDMYRFTITPNTPSASFQPYAFDAEGVEIGEYITDPLGVVTLTVLITTSQVQPLVVNVYSEGLPTDYTLSGDQLFGHEEVEDNDTQAEANPQPAPVFTVNGSLGPAGTDDGDSTDWYRFTPGINDKPLLVMWYDTALMSFAFDTAPPQITDSNGTVVCIGQDGNAAFGIPETVVFNFESQVGGSPVMPLVVNLSPAAGSSSYWFERFPR
jgi:hypothetical protein